MQAPVVAAGATESEEAGRAAIKPREGFWAKLFSRTDTIVYVLVGIFFFLAALLSLGYGLGKFGYSIWSLAQSGFGAIQPGSTAPSAIIDFVSDLLLTLIIMEVLGTIVQYLRFRETSLTPFLVIGIISATRGILAVGARLSIAESGSLKPDDFRNDMIELAVNAGVIIALGLTMRMIGPYLRERAPARHRTNHSAQGARETQRRGV